MRKSFITGFVGQLLMPELEAKVSALIEAEDLPTYASFDDAKKERVGSDRTRWTFPNHSYIECPDRPGVDHDLGIPIRWYVHVGQPPLPQASKDAGYSWNTLPIHITDALEKGVVMIKTGSGDELVPATGVVTEPGLVIASPEFSYQYSHGGYKEWELRPRVLGKIDEPLAWLHEPHRMSEIGLFNECYGDAMGLQSEAIKAHLNEVWRIRGQPLQRAETGPLEFFNDWPGVFLRGDDALAFAEHLEDFMRVADGRFECQLLATVLEGLVKILRSCALVDGESPEGVQHAALGKL